MSDFDLDRFLPYRLAVAAGDVSRGFARRYRARFDISVAEWRVVAHLNHSGPVSVREITQRVDLEKSRVSRAAARLETAGFVHKKPNPEDGRLVLLSLTPSGQEMVAVIAQEAQSYQEELLKRVNLSEAACCALLLALAGPDR